MKIESPKKFVEWLQKYNQTANFFIVAEVVHNEDQRHALFLCLRDAFIAGRDAGPEPVKEDK